MRLRAKEIRALLKAMELLGWKEIQGKEEEK